MNKEAFDFIKDQIKLMSDKQLAELNFEVFVEAHERASKTTKAEIESEIESLISETNKPR